MRMLAVTYYGKRHLTTGSKAMSTAADMAGFKLRVPPVDTFRAMAEAWGARATPINFNELYLALSQGAVDGQENPLPTIQSAKLNEVQKFLVLTGHIITPRLVIANEASWKGLPDADRGILQARDRAARRGRTRSCWRRKATLVDTFKKAGMTVIEPDVESFRKPVLEKVPAQFESKWGKGTWESLPRSEARARRAGGLPAGHGSRSRLGRRRCAIAACGAARTRDGWAWSRARSTTRSPGPTSLRAS